MFYDVYSFGFIFEEVDSCKSICYFVVVQKVFQQLDKFDVLEEYFVIKFVCFF